MENTKRIAKKLISSRELGLFAVLFIICLAMSLVTTSFLFMLNVMNILKQVPLTALIAMSQTFVITSGGIDLSVGFVMDLSSIIMCTLNNWSVPLPITIIACLACGLLFGALNGVLFTRLKLPPFIITLGMQYMDYMDDWWTKLHEKLFQLTRATNDGGGVLP